jgi:hypothetical protein
MTNTPTTHAPVTNSPTSHAPVTIAPTSHAPVVTTNTPTTHAPVTTSPTSHAPVTIAPTSHAPVTPSPTRAPAVAPRFTAVGQGQCQDSGGRLYDLVFLNGQTQDINAAYNWCLTATEVKSKLVGVEISTNGDWICRYDDGAIDNIKTTDFNPAALSTSNPPGAGQGAVVSSDGTSDITCYKILVCRESIPTALFHFLLSLSRPSPILSY